jgi:hypothetical protein
VEQKKRKPDVEQFKEKMLQKFKDRLDKLFAPETFDLTFDEREKLIDAMLDKGRCEVLEEHIEKDPHGIAKNDYTPDETQSCHCGACAPLCRDAHGNPKFFEREVKTKRGSIKTKEYGYFCSKCRKVFFPSPKKAKTIQRKLQP